jgi:hypothetical protein
MGHLQTYAVRRNWPAARTIGFAGPGRGIKNATEGVHRGARWRGGVAGLGLAQAPATDLLLVVDRDEVNGRAVCSDACLGTRQRLGRPGILPRRRSGRVFEFSGFETTEDNGVGINTRIGACIPKGQSGRWVGHAVVNVHEDGSRRAPLGIKAGLAGSSGAAEERQQHRHAARCLAPRRAASTMRQSEKLRFNRALVQRHWIGNIRCSYGVPGHMT